MRVKLRPDGSRLRQHEIENRLYPRFNVPGQFETIGQKGLHHQSRLIFRGILLRARLNVEPIVVDPGRQVRQVALTNFQPHRAWTMMSHLDILLELVETARIRPCLSKTRPTGFSSFKARWTS